MFSPARLTFQLVLLAVPTVAHAATIEFVGNSTVSGDYLVLKDVATVRTGDAETTQRLENAVLGPAPSPGRRTSLDAAAVRSRLRALNFDVASFDFSGHSRIVVTGEAVEKSRPALTITRPETPVRDWQVKRAEQLLVDEFRRHLRHRAPELGLVDVTLEVPRDAAPAIIEARVGGYQFTGGGPNWNEPQSITVRYIGRERQVRESTIAVDVQPLPHVLVAAQDLPRGHVIRAENLTQRQIENAADGLADPRLLVGKETRKAIRTGNVVASSDVRSVPLVRANDIVTLVSRSGGIAVQSYARARRDGALGDEIAVQTIEKRELLVGRVTGYHEVEIVTAGSQPSNANARTTATVPGFRFESGPRQGRLDGRSAAPQPASLAASSSVRPESQTGMTAPKPLVPEANTRPRVSSNSKLVLRTAVPGSY